ncbi:hypothetical protein ATERTT37_006519 [Aspergillus terreus]
MASDGQEVKGDRESLKRSRAEFEDDEPTDDNSEYSEFDDSDGGEWWEEDKSEDESEDLDRERDIEEHEYITSGDTPQTVKIRLFLTNEYDEEEMGESRWMTNFVAECTCDGVVVATALARYIHREGIRPEFWEKLEEPSEETCDVAFHVFDRYGTVKAKYKDHPVQKGTGVWGNELDHGPLFLIENFMSQNRICAGKHQSRAVVAASDFDPRRSHAEDLENEELQMIYEADRSTEVKKMKMERLRDALPLHHAALTVMDEELKTFFATHADDEIGWDRVTNSEATLLHITACQLKSLSTQWLLDNVHYANRWKTARNIDGYTPLEALQETLETRRTRKDYGFFRISNISDCFEGYPDAAVSCLSLLSGQEALGLNRACLRYGCTCGECVGGFLSARMRFSLIIHGQENFDLAQDGIDDGGFWIEASGHRLEHLGLEVRENLKTNKSLRKGFVNMFQIAVECLKARQVPTAENLKWFRDNQSEWPPHTKNYLRRAGTWMGCRAVLRYMFDRAKEEDEKAGDGQCQLVFNKEWSRLPTCRNDHEFEFVARACGYAADDVISFPC